MPILDPPKSTVLTWTPAFWASSRASCTPFLSLPSLKTSISRWEFGRPPSSKPWSAMRMPAPRSDAPS